MIGLRLNMKGLEYTPIHREEVTIPMNDFAVKFAAQLSGIVLRDDKLALAAQTMWQGFHVKHDEVAIFLYDKNNETLNFIWPPALRTAGFVPVSAHHSMVAKTAREKKAFLDNNFASTPHVNIFEHFRIENSGKVPIQKIMSAPMLVGDDLKGVIQVSRKGENRETAGDDFSADQLAALSRLASLIGSHL
jgi:hypothetical protein